MAKRVWIAARDLVFRAKLQAVVAAMGAETTRDASQCDLAVVELGARGVGDRIRELTGRGVPVLAFGAHVNPDALRAARALGARAEPNSRVETVLRALLAR